MRLLGNNQSAQHLLLAAHKKTGGMLQEDLSKNKRCRRSEDSVVNDAWQ
jgi:hypothetical protein